MIDKYLRRFCAQEIQIMIAKMEDDYGAFTGYPATWGRLLEAQAYMTKLERYCVRKAKRRAARNYERQQYLGAILKQQLNPMTREEMEDAKPMNKATILQYQQQLSAQQQMKHHMANQMMNAAGNPYVQGTYK